MFAGVTSSPPTAPTLLLLLYTPEILPNKVSTAPLRKMLVAEAWNFLKFLPLSLETLPIPAANLLGFVPVTMLVFDFGFDVSLFCLETSTSDLILFTSLSREFSSDFFHSPVLVTLSRYSSKPDSSISVTPSTRETNLSSMTSTFVATRPTGILRRSSLETICVSLLRSLILLDATCASIASSVNCSSEKSRYSSTV